MLFSALVWLFYLMRQKCLAKVTNMNWRSSGLLPLALLSALFSVHSSRVATGGKGCPWITFA